MTSQQINYIYNGITCSIIINQQNGYWFTTLSN